MKAFVLVEVPWFDLDGWKQTHIILAKSREEAIDTAKEELNLPDDLGCNRERSRYYYDFVELPLIKTKATTKA